MTIKDIARYAKIKGLQIVGTGDFTHPQWLKEIQDTLDPETDTQLYRAANNPELPISFMLTTEVCTIFEHENQSKKVHHVILTPSIDHAIQINEALSKHGNLEADGRPILSMLASQLVEEIIQISDKNMVFPAHAWTPWFSIFGAYSGFDNVEDCYQDMTKHIHAIETGLSSDPPMNWRISKLDRFTLVSNSDSHSFWPWRIGREANVFELEKPSYEAVTNAIRYKDTNCFKFTIETEPAYGKYHWTGHRNCNISLSPSEAKKFNNICPVCRRKFTLGVEQRIEDLADRPEGFKANNSPGYMRLLPLSEIIAAVLKVESPSTAAVWKIYNSLIEKFGNEYNVLIGATREEIASATEPIFAENIIQVREGLSKVVPGYDGVYGKLVLNTNSRSQTPTTQIRTPGGVKQRNLADFW
jgi:uncharacterized protein (TIGR00375 family)